MVWHTFGQYVNIWTQAMDIYVRLLLLRRYFLFRMSTNWLMMWCQNQICVYCFLRMTLVNCIDWLMSAIKSYQNIKLCRSLNMNNSNKRIINENAQRTHSQIIILHNFDFNLHPNLYLYIWNQLDMVNWNWSVWIFRR